MKKFLRPLVVLAVVGLPAYSLFSYWQQQTDETVATESSSEADMKARNNSGVASDDRNLPLNSSTKQNVTADKRTDGASKQNLGTNRVTTDTASTPKQLEDARKRYNQVVSNSRYPTLDARITALEALYPQQSFQPNELVDLLAEPNAWHPTDVSSQATQELPLTPEQRNDGRKFIELKPERLVVTLPGDSLELPIEQLGGNLHMKVDSREVLPNGGFILHGRLTNTDEVMRVTLTQTPGLSLAGIDTPKGHYVLQANDGQGWIASSDTLFKQDKRQHDMVVPPGS